MTSIRNSLRSLASTSSVASSSRHILPALSNAFSSRRSYSNTESTSTYARDKTISAGYDTLASILNPSASSSSSRPSTSTPAHYPGGSTSAVPEVMAERIQTPEYTREAIPPIVDPALGLLVNTLMKHGKKEEARRMVREVLEEIQRTTNQDPVPLVHRALTLASPSVRLKTIRRSAKSHQIPSALNARQRTHQAISWIFKAAEKGRAGGLGLSRAKRIGREMMSVLDGSSTALQRKDEVHRLAALNRSNLTQRL